MESFVEAGCLEKNAAKTGEEPRASARPARRIAACVTLFAFALAVPLVADADGDALAAVRADEQQRVEVFAQAAKAVVCVFADDRRGGGGSGVVIDPAGYGLTNFHVVQSFIGTRRGYGGLSDGRLYPLKVLGIDPGGDIVMFKLEGKERFDHAPLGDSDKLRVGQWVAAMGNPFLLAEDFTPTITLGVISGLRRYQEGRGNLLEYADCIQVSTSINPGNSGGPLFDMAGRVIGINGRASFEERGRVNVGLGYAVSVNQIRRFLPGLRAGRLLEHGTLGATVRLTGERLIIGSIQEFSSAERVGVELGDELLEVAGRRVRTPNDYNNIMAILPADWPVTLRLRRDGEPIELTTRLERLPLRMSLQYVPDIEHNHAELLGVLDRAASADITRGEEPWASAIFQGQVRSAGAGEGRAWTVFVGTYRATEPDENGLDPTLRDEWRVLTRPLLARPEPDLRWELLAGDEVDGRLVNVIERRLDDDRRVRWKFDWRTDELRQVVFGTADDPEVATWTPANRKEFDGLRWPFKWSRRTRTGDELTLEIESIEFVSPEPLAAPVESAAEEDGQ